MAWKRGFVIAFCGCALWLYVNGTARAQDGPPKDEKAPRAHQKNDTPPGTPRHPREAGPRNEDFDDAGPGPDEFGPMGPPRSDGGVWPPGQPQAKYFLRWQEGPGPQVPPGVVPPGMQPGMAGGMGGVVEMQSDGNNVTYRRIQGQEGPGSVTAGPGGMPGAPGMPGGMPGMRTGGMAYWIGNPDMDAEMVELARREAELDHHSAMLAEKYRRTGENGRGEIQKQIEKLVSEQFDLRQERRQKEVKRLEEQIKKLHDSIEKRQKAKADIIDRRVKDLLGQDDDTRF